MTLTQRQTEIRALLRLGFQNKQIAARLGISPPTVKSHLEKLYRRIGVRNRTQAAMWD